MNTDKVNARQLALIAGIAYLIAIFVTPYSWINPLIQLNNADVTLANATDHSLLFRLACACWIVVIVADTVVGWALFWFFKPLHKPLSLLTMVMRLVFAPIMFLAVLQWLNALQLVATMASLSGTALTQVQTLAMHYFSSFDLAVNIAFTVFGLHVGLLGYLSYQSKVVPTWIGVCLMVAAFGYQIDGFASVLFPAYATNPYGFLVTIAVPAFLSEFMLTIWLLLQGRKLKPVEVY